MQRFVLENDLLTLNINFLGVSGSRRRNGNTRILTRHALAAATEFKEEVNGQLLSNGLKLRIQLNETIYEAHFDDHDDIIRDFGVCDAFLLSSPVYFGSISPSMNMLLQEISATGMNNSSKVASSITVGTQRNGGQETAIEDLWRWYIANNVPFVGNGPVTSQYGGTAWGGGRGAVEKDIYGISTSRGAGKRAIQESIIRAIGLAALSSHTNNDKVSVLFGDRSASQDLKRDPLFNKLTKIKLKFFLFSDSQKISEHIEETFNGIRRAHEEFIRTINNDNFGIELEFDHLALSSMLNVKDCAACTICPPGNDKKKDIYGCIYSDDVNREFPRFNSASTIICDCKDHNGLVSPLYWIVLNRMRSVRRNNYMLTGKLGTTVETGLSSNNHIAMKWLIRNNMGMLSSSSGNYNEFGSTLYRETLIRTLGREIASTLNLDLWTPPNHHE